MPPPLWVYPPPCWQHVDGPPWGLAMQHGTGYCCPVQYIPGQMQLHASMGHPLPLGIGAIPMPPLASWSIPPCVRNGCMVPRLPGGCSSASAAAGESGPSLAIVALQPNGCNCQLPLLRGMGRFPAFGPQPKTIPPFSPSSLAPTVARSNPQPGDDMGAPYILWGSDVISPCCRVMTSGPLGI